MKVFFIIIAVIIGILGLNSIVRPMIDTIRHREKFVSRGQYLQSLIGQILVTIAIIIITIIAVVQIARGRYE